MSAVFFHPLNPKISNINAPEKLPWDWTKRSNMPSQTFQTDTCVDESRGHLALECGRVQARARGERAGLPRASRSTGSFSNLEEIEEEVLSFPRDVTISIKIREVSTVDDVPYIFEFGALSFY
jgi:hypothetical protein